jgi:hypothetical protein
MFETRLTHGADGRAPGETRRSGAKPLNCEPSTQPKIHGRNPWTYRDETPRRDRRSEDLAICLQGIAKSLRFNDGGARRNGRDHQGETQMRQPNDMTNTASTQPGKSWAKPKKALRSISGRTGSAREAYDALEQRDAPLAAGEGEVCDLHGRPHGGLAARLSACRAGSPFASCHSKLDHDETHGPTRLVARQNNTCLMTINQIG